MTEYTVFFDFNCISKKGLVSGKSGEVDITSDVSIEELKTSSELRLLIVEEMARKTKKSILSLDIININIRT